MKNMGINEVKRIAKDLAVELNISITCEKVGVRTGAVDYRFYATNLLPSSNTVRIADITMYTRIGKKAYAHQVERFIKEFKKEVKINREFPTINIKRNAEAFVEKYNYNKDDIAKELIKLHEEEKISCYQWVSIYNAALGLIVEEKGSILWEETPLTTEKEEQNVSRETTPAPKKYYKAFIYNPNKKYLGDFRGNHKYYNGGQFSSKKGFCVCDDPKLCVGFMECHLEEGETLEIYEVQALNQQPSNTETELVFKTITLVRRLRPGKDF